MTQKVETLYDWLIQVKGMPEHIAQSIDDRIPEIADIPTPQTLWQYAGVVTTADERDGDPGDPGLLMDLYFYFDQMERWATNLAEQGSVYAKVYREQRARTKLRLKGDPRYHDKRDVLHARARRQAAQVLLGHIWEVCYRLDFDAEPPSHFARPIAPEVPFPEVGTRV